MFKTVLNFLRGPREIIVGRPAGQTCFNCGYWSYCDPDDIDHVDGYCGVNFAHDARAEYGSWTTHDNWCRYWEEADAATLTERRYERALALRKAADAVDPHVDSTGKPSTRD